MCEREKIYSQKFQKIDNSYFNENEDKIYTYVLIIIIKVSKMIFYEVILY